MLDLQCARFIEERAEATLRPKILLRPALPIKQTGVSVQHDHEHAVSGLRGGGVICPPELVLDYDLLLGNLLRLCRLGLDGHCVVRFKGLLHTTAGWFEIQVANDEVIHGRTLHRRDTRIDWVCDGLCITSDQMLIELNRTLDIAELQRALRKPQSPD